MIDTAVIMAAGKGTRFGSRTTDMPKGFIEFKGKPMIERSIETLLSVGIKHIIIGTGYHKEWYENLVSRYPEIITVFSPDFATTNSMETLYQCRNAVAVRSFLLLESDIVYEPKALQLLLDDPHSDIMLVSNVTKFQDQYYISVDNAGNLLGCSTDENALIRKFGNKPYGELVGIHKISNQYYQEMVKDYEIHRSKYLKRGYEFEIEGIATSNIAAGVGDKEDRDTSDENIRQIKRSPMFVLKPEKLQWYEIDDEEDLHYAEADVNIS